MVSGGNIELQDFVKIIGFYKKNRARLIKKIHYTIESPVKTGRSTEARHPKTSQTKNTFHFPHLRAAFEKYDPLSTFTCNI
jgi:hypothetical protein